MCVLFWNFSNGAIFYTHSLNYSPQFQLWVWTRGASCWFWWTYPLQKVLVGNGSPSGVGLFLITRTFRQTVPEIWTQQRSSNWSTLCPCSGGSMWKVMRAGPPHWWRRGNWKRPFLTVVTTTPPFEPSPYSRSAGSHFVSLSHRIWFGQRDFQNSLEWVSDPRRDRIRRVCGSSVKTSGPQRFDDKQNFKLTKELVHVLSVFERKDTERNVANLFYIWKWITILL